jgi:hypothetical protein
MTTADFRRIALSFDGAEEGSHMGAVDFRVGGRIFATLASVKDGFGNLALKGAARVGRVDDAMCPEKTWSTISNLLIPND